MRESSATGCVPKCTVVRPSAKPLPESCRLAPMKPPFSPSVTSLSVGTICSSTPAPSRSRRTCPVVALMGTTTVMVCVPRFTLVGVMLTSPRLPLSSSVANTTRSPATSPEPESTMLCPVLAEARVACAGVPLAALAPMLDIWLLPAASRSRLSA